MNKKLNVALIYNKKPSNLDSVKDRFFINTHIHKDTFAEWDSEKTVNAIAEALSNYHNINKIEADIYCYEKLLANRPDIVFNVSEGFNYASREAQIPAILDLLNIPYTGSDPQTLINCLDKVRTKEILSHNNIPTPEFLTFSSIDEITNFDKEFVYPAIVKPAFEGSSKGIFFSSIVHNIFELKEKVAEIIKQYRQTVLVEKLILGREFTVAILGNTNELEVLPLVEINYPDDVELDYPIYSYELKWELDTPEKPLEIFKCPAEVEKKLENEIINIACAAFKTMRCKDWCRIDIRLDENNIPNIIELNPLPGILPDPNENSCFPKAAYTKGYTYSEMLNRVITLALKRWEMI